MASIAYGKVWMVTTMIGVPLMIASVNCWLFDFELASLSIAAIRPS